MPSICSNLCNLMSLPPYIAVSEAKSKLQDTFLIINGELVYVENINDERIQVLKEGDNSEYVAIRGKDILTIEVWLPISGIYIVEGLPVHLWKIPKRQWRKSFSWNYYTTNHGNVDAYKLYKSKPMELYRYKNDLMYYDLKIGNFSGGEIIPIVDDFKFEIDLYREHVREKV